MYCEKCGKELRDGARFCPGCGAALKTVKHDKKELADISNTASDNRITPAGPKSGKSKTTAGILGIFLGGLGLHKFYMGNIKMGIIYILFCWTYIPAIVGLIEGIIYLTEPEEKFERRLM